MMKGPFDPKDIPGLPREFGRRTNNVIPFPRRPEGVKPPAAAAKPLPAGGGDDPLDMLKWLVWAIENGHIAPEAAFVGTIQLMPDGSETYPFYVCGLTRLAVKGLLNEYLEDLP